MRPSLGKNHIGNLASPVKGMDLGNWLARARMLEDKLVNMLARTDIDIEQQSKVHKLLKSLRADIAVQIKRTI